MRDERSTDSQDAVGVDVKTVPHRRRWIASGVLAFALAVGDLSLHAREARGLYPNNPTTRDEYSRGIQKLRDFDALGARAHFERVIAAEPGFPLSHSALASALSTLGYDSLARAASKRAFDLSKSLPMDERKRVEGQYRKAHHDWGNAVQAYRALVKLAPDRIDYGIALADVQVRSGKGEAAFATIAALRKRSQSLADDVQIDLAEAEAAKAVTDFERQLEAARAAAAKAQSLDAKLLLAQARYLEGAALVDLGRLDEGQKAAAGAVMLFDAGGDHGHAAAAENLIGIAYARNGDMAEAQKTFQRCLDTFRRLGDQRGIAKQLANVANAIETARTDEKGKIHPEALAEAKLRYVEALAVSRGIDDQTLIALALNNLGTVLEEMSDFPGSLAAFEESLRIYRGLRETSHEALAIANIAYVHYRQKRLAEAKTEYEQSLKISRRMEAWFDVAGTLRDYAKVLATLGDFAGSDKAIEEAAMLFRREDPTEEERVYAQLADVYAELGKASEAAKLRERASRVAGATP